MDKHISELTNPKRALARREAEAEGEGAAPRAASAPDTNYARGFSRGFSREERLRQQKALAEALRRRQ